MKTGKKLLSLLLAAIMVFSTIAVSTVVSYADDGNGSYNTATALVLGTAATGDLSDAADVDWYSFKAANTADATLTFEHEEKTGTNTYFRISVYDEAGAVNSTNALKTIDSKANDSKNTAAFAVTKDATYYVRVYIGSEEAATLGYTLTVANGTGSVAPPELPEGNRESEDNNSFNQADEIPLDALMNGNLSSGTDKDYYFFRIDSEGVLDIEFSHEVVAGQTSSYFRLSVYNEGGNAVEGLNGIPSPGNVGIINLDNTQIPAGKYYIEITKGVVESAINYQLFVSISAPTPYDAETENNNAYNEADKIKLGKPMKGALTETITGNDDSFDYYSFETEDGGRLSVVFEHDVSNAADARDNYFSLVVYDSDNRSIASVKSKGEDGRVSIDRMNIGEGKYYIMITNAENKNSDLEYTITVNVLNFEGMETESNDDEDKANKIDIKVKETSKLYSANLGSATDVDFFRITVKEPGYIYINLYNESPSSRTEYTVGLYTESTGSGEVNLMRIHETTIEGSDDYKSPSIGLGDAGKSVDYFIKVSTSSYDAGEYSLSVYYSNAVTFETESNNTRESANKLARTDMYTYASLFDANDEDWFTFNFDNKKYCEIKCQINAASSAASTAETLKWEVNLYAQGQTEPVDYFVFTNKEAGSFKMDESLPSGTYYLQVVKYGSNTFSSADYSITLASSDNDSGLNFFQRIWKAVSAMDWGGFWERNFNWVNQIDWAKAVVYLGNALASLIPILLAVIGIK